MMGGLKQWARTKLREWSGTDSINSDLKKLAAKTEGLYDVIHNLPVSNGTGSDRRVVGDPSKFLIDPEFFSEYSEERAKRLYYENVEVTFLETHSYCNRTCWFCPNSIIDRRTQNQRMSEHLVDKVLAQLSEINYRGDLGLCLYNEPLADAEIEIKIQRAKKILPNTRIHTVSNGDYLTRERLVSLCNAGLDRLMISLYIDDNIETAFDYNTALCTIHSKAEGLGLPTPEVHTKPNKDQCLATARLADLNIFFVCQDHRRQTCSRAGAMPDSTPVKRVMNRIKPCMRPYSVFPISYNGAVGCCCNIHADYDGHKDLIVGDINTESIYQIYFGKKAASFRKRMINEVNAAPCGTCSVHCESMLFNMPNESCHTVRRYRTISL